MMVARSFKALNDLATIILPKYLCISNVFSCLVVACPRCGRIWKKTLDSKLKGIYSFSF
jgi:hypothetical protein